MDISLSKGGDRPLIEKCMGEIAALKMEVLDGTKTLKRNVIIFLQSQKYEVTLSHTHASWKMQLLA